MEVRLAKAAVHRRKVSMEVVARARSLKAARSRGRLALRASRQASSSPSQGEVNWATTPAASLLSASPLVSSARVSSTMASPSTSSKAATPSPTQQRQPRHLKAAMARADSDLEVGEESKEVRELIAPELTNSRHRLLPSRAAREEKFNQTRKKACLKNYLGQSEQRLQEEGEVPV